MNKSLEYIKNRILNDIDVLNMPIEGWDNALICNPIDKYLCYLPSIKECFTSENKFETTLCGNGNEIQLKTTIIYDNNVEFDYFTMESTTHDGTIYFLEEAIKELLFRLLKAGTYYKNKISEEDMEKILHTKDKYEIQYTIGDIIIHRTFETGKETDLLVLPIKFDVIERS